MPEGYDNELSGALFRNDKKETDKHPDYKGQAQVGGTEYWVSGWIKTSKAGKKYMSLSFTAKDAPRQAPDPAPPGPISGDDMPF